MKKISNFKDFIKTSSKQFSRDLLSLTVTITNIKLTFASISEIVPNFSKNY